MLDTEFTFSAGIELANQPVQVPNTPQAEEKWEQALIQEINYDYTKTFQDCKRCNGLMLHSGDFIKEVYCAVFPCPEILEKVLATTKGEALFF